MVLHPRPLRDQATSDLLERRALYRSHFQVHAWVGLSTKQCCRGVERMRACCDAATFSYWPHRIGSVGRGGLAGSKWSPVRPGARRGGGAGK